MMMVLPLLSDSKEEYCFDSNESESDMDYEDEDIPKQLPTR